MLAAILLLSMVTIIVHESKASSLTPHQPIVINGNAGFTASNGVIGGRGIRSDPYVISSWNITASSNRSPNGPTGPGISVTDTDAYFVIQNVISFEWGFPGLVMTHVANGAVSQSVLSGYPWTLIVNSSRNIDISSEGMENPIVSHVRILVTQSDRITVDNSNVFWMEIDNSKHVSIRSNTFGGVRCPLCINDSSNVVITGNVIVGCDCVSVEIGRSDHVAFSRNSVAGDYPFKMWESSFVQISDNRILGGVETAIDLSGCSAVAFVRNEISIYQTPDSGAALRVDACNGMVVSRNTIGLSKIYPPPISGLKFDAIQISQSSEIFASANRLSNSTTALSTSDSSDITVVENVLQSNVRGVVLNSTMNVQVFHNNFLNNTVQAVDDQGTANVWDNGYPSGGNFWSDYTGTDPDHDGIGDTPYIFNVNQDRFPLMQPLQL